MKRLVKSLAILVLAFSLILTSCGKTETKTNGDSSTATKKLKVALLLPGTINDNGWNATAYNGLKLIKEKLGADIAYTEKVAQSDQEEVFRNYATQGYDLIIGHGFEFTDAADRVAKDFPNVKFLITSTNTYQDPNVASVNTNPAQMGFLEGIMAGLATKANSVGAVGGQELPPIVSAVKGFEAGVKYINPSCKVITTMTGDFDDAVKAKEAAKAIIGQGADVVMLDADQAGLGVIEACKDKGVYAVSSISDQSSIAPDTVLGSGISDVPKAMEIVANHVLSGDFKSQFYNLGVSEGAVYYISNSKFESIYKAKVDQALEDIKSGKIKVEDLIK